MSDTTFEAGEVAELTRVVDGRAVRYLSRGSGPDIVLFLHSGQPGIPPFAGSSVLFESTLQSVRLDGYRLIAPDLPGAGGTALRGLEDLTVRGVTRAVSALLAGLGPVGSIHIVAQGAAGLPAMKMAREGVAGVLPSSVMLIGANTAAPTSSSPWTSAASVAAMSTNSR